jgi:hypothetical protein
MNEQTQARVRQKRQKKKKEINIFVDLGGRAF